MKCLKLYISSLFLSIAAVCQPNPNGPKVPVLHLVQNKIVYTETIYLDSSYSKEKLFNNAQQWYRHNFESADNILTINNIDEGKISGTGIIHAHKRENKIDESDIFFTIDIITVKGSYEYRLDSLYGFGKTGKFYYSDIYNEEQYPTDKPKWPKTYRDAMLINMDIRISKVIAQLKTDMANTSPLK